MKFIKGRIKSLLWSIELLKEDFGDTPPLIRELATDISSILDVSERITLFSVFTRRPVGEIVRTKDGRVIRDTRIDFLPPEYQVLYENLAGDEKMIFTRHYLLGRITGEGEGERIREGLSYIRLEETGDVADPQRVFGNHFIPILSFLAQDELKIIRDDVIAKVSYPVLYRGKKTGEESVRYLAVYILRYPYSFYVPLYRLLSQTAGLDIVSIQVAQRIDAYTERKRLEQIRAFKQGLADFTRNTALKEELKHLDVLIRSLADPDIEFVKTAWVLVLVGDASMQEEEFIRRIARFEALVRGAGYYAKKPLYANIPVLKQVLHYAFRSSVPPIPLSLIPLEVLVASGLGYCLRFSDGEVQTLGGKRYYIPFPIGLSLEVGLRRNTRGDYAGVNVWSHQSFNQLVIGEMGSGKSYLMKTLLTRQIRLLGVDAVILDTASLHGRGEYRDLAEKVVRDDGVSFRIYRIDKSGEYGFKLLDPKLEDDLFAQQIDTIISFLIETEEGRRASIEVKNEIREWALDGKEQGSWDISKLSPEAQTYMRRLIDPQIGEYRWLFAPQNEIDITAPLLYLDLSEIQAEAHKFTMFLTLFLIQVWQRIRKANAHLKGQKLPPWHPDAVRTIIVLDEAWRFLMHRSTASLLQNFLVDSRKQFAGLWVATQSLADFTIGEDYQIKLGRKLWDESTLKFIRVREGGSVEDLKKLGIPSGIAEAIPIMPKHAFMLEAKTPKGNRYAVVRVEATDEEREIATTLIQ